MSFNLDLMPRHYCHVLPFPTLRLKTQWLLYVTRRVMDNHLQKIKHFNLISWYLPVVVGQWSAQLLQWDSAQVGLWCPTGYSGYLHRPKSSTLGLFGDTWFWAIGLTGDLYSPLSPGALRDVLQHTLVTIHGWVYLLLWHSVSVHMHSSVQTVATAAMVSLTTELIAKSRSHVKRKQGLSSQEYLRILTHLHFSNKNIEDIVSIHY